MTTSSVQEVKSASKMKNNHLILSVVVALAVFLPRGKAAVVNLGSASSFAVLAGSAVTSTGPTILNGDLGVSPGTTFGAFPPGTVNGTIHAADTAAQQAQSDLSTAYTDAATLPYDTLYGDAFDLGGKTLAPGVYKGSSSLFLGPGTTLTLDAGTHPNAVWIFQATDSTLITGSGSTVALINGAQANNVFWQVGSSATLGTGTDFAGNILASASITLYDGATISGRALAMNGAVTLNNNDITVPTITAVPEPATLWPALCASVLCGWQLIVRRPKAGHS